MKRGPGRQRPLDIVEVPAARPDPRSAEPDVNPRPDRAATQKISREDLEEALRRTKSGTRRAVRSEHELPPNDADPRRERDSLPGPRDDDDAPSMFPTRATPTPPPSAPVPVAMTTPVPPVEIRVLETPSTPSTPVVLPERHVLAHLTPRTAFLAGLAVALFVIAAAMIGFFAGRFAPGSR